MSPGDLSHRAGFAGSSDVGGQIKLGKRPHLDCLASELTYGTATRYPERRYPASC